jgi:hypothetical protein
MYEGFQRAIEKFFIPEWAYIPQVDYEAFVKIVETMELPEKAKKLIGDELLSPYPPTVSDELCGELYKLNTLKFPKPGDKSFLFPRILTCAVEQLRPGIAMPMLKKAIAMGKMIEKWTGG